MGDHKHNPNAQGNVVPIGFRQMAQRVPVPSDGFCVVAEEELETRGGVLLVAGKGALDDERKGAVALRLVATSGVILLPSGGKFDHPAQPGDYVFLMPNAQGTKDHPLWPSNTALIRILDIAGYLPDESGREAAKVKARAAAAGLAVPETVQ